jgi:hypothetical protein
VNTGPEDFLFTDTDSYNYVDNNFREWHGVVVASYILWFLIADKCSGSRVQACLSVWVKLYISSLPQGVLVGMARYAGGVPHYFLNLVHQVGSVHKCISSLDWSSNSSG